MGFLITRFGWASPFTVLTVLGCGMFATIWWMFPRQDANHVPARNPWANLGTVLKNVPALAGISITLWASAGNELVSLIFGVWLEDSFGLQITALAGASAVIGLSELGGEGLAATLTDRIGKPRAIILGLSANSVAAVLLPFIGRTEIGALIGLFLFYITFEYMLVSHIPMISELAPGARATTMAFNVSGHSIGRAIGAFLAPFIYEQFGFVFVALLAAVFNIVGLLALRIMQKDGSSQ